MPSAGAVGDEVGQVSGQDEVGLAAEATGSVLGDRPQWVGSIE